MSYISVISVWRRLRTTLCTAHTEHRSSLTKQSLAMHSLNNACQDSMSVCRRHVFRKEEAHRTGKLTTLCAHPQAPIFATASDLQVVKIWTDDGEMSSSIRMKPQSHVRTGRITCMSFSPFMLKLATGAMDVCCTVYQMCNDDRGSKPPSRVASIPGDAMSPA